MTLKIPVADLLHSRQRHYLDLAWDTLPRPERDGIVLSHAKETALFAKRHVPFYRAHFKAVEEREIEAFGSLEELTVTLPETTKDHLSKNPFSCFLPDAVIVRSEREEQYDRNKGTGGTTGKPVTIIYSPEDWRAMAMHIARSVKYDYRDRLGELSGMTVVGLYHGDHVTNEVYRSGLGLLGMRVFGRVSTKSDVHALYEFIQEVRPNAILAPPEDAAGAQTKGSTLDAILKLDARNARPGSYRLHHRDNPGFKAIFWSSMPISRDLQEYILGHLEIPYQQAQFGSTEVCPTGATCSHFPRDFHLGYGPTLVQLKHSSGRRTVAREEEGRVLVSKIGGALPDGRTIVPTGSMIINYRTGDVGMLLHQGDPSCPCGRSTPVLFGVHRAEHVAAKALFGCQAD